MVYKLTACDVDADKQGFLDCVRHAYMLAGWGHDTAVWWDGQRFRYGFWESVPVGQCVLVVLIYGYRHELRHRDRVGSDVAHVVADDVLEDVYERCRVGFDPWDKPVMI